MKRMDLVNYSRKKKYILTFGHLMPSYVLTPIFAIIAFYVDRSYLITNPVIVDEIRFNIYIKSSLLMAFFCIPIAGLYAYKQIVLKHFPDLKTSLIGAFKFNLIWRIIIVLFILISAALIFYVRQFCSSETKSVLIYLIAGIGSILAVVLKISPIIATAKLWSNKPFHYLLSNKIYTE